MHADDEPTASQPSIDRRFAALVGELGRDDPQFVRRTSPPARRRLARADTMIVLGVLATVVLGFVPLAVGVSLQAVTLLVIGAVGCLVTPIAAPLLVRGMIARHRPLWT